MSAKTMPEFEDVKTKPKNPAQNGLDLYTQGFNNGHAAGLVAGEARLARALQSLLTKFSKSREGVSIQWLKDWLTARLKRRKK